MKALKWLSAITAILGIVFIIYGWTQSWGFSADHLNYTEELIKTTVKTYVFIVGGIIMLIIGISLQLVRECLQKLGIEFYELNQK